MGLGVVDGVYEGAGESAGGFDQHELAPSAIS
jgi:hypothetical protein